MESNTAHGWVSPGGTGEPCKTTLTSAQNKREAEEEFGVHGSHQPSVLIRRSKSFRLMRSMTSSRPGQSRNSSR